MPRGALALSVLALLVSLFATDNAQAACKEVSTNNFECTGALNNIRANASDSFPPDTARSIIVESLTSDIPGGIFYVAPRKNNQPVSLSVTTGDFDVNQSSTGATILVETTGFGGANRSTDTLGTKTGGTSAAGGPATFTLSGSIRAENATGPIITITSISGNGGNGSTQTKDNGGGGGGGGGISDPAGTVTFNIAEASSITSPKGGGVSMLSQGGTGGEGGASAIADGGRGGPAVPAARCV